MPQIKFTPKQMLDLVEAVAKEKGEIPIRMLDRQNDLLSGGEISMKSFRKMLAIGIRGKAEAHLWSYELRQKETTGKYYLLVCVE